MRILVFFNILSVLLISLHGCCPDPAVKALLRAESIMESDASGALAILDSVSPIDSIGSLGKRALFDGSQDKYRFLYNLLAAEAMYKNSLPVPEDSILTATGEYFQSIHDERRFMRTSFVQGRGRFDREEYARSIVSARTAMKLARQLKDTLYMARAEQLIADIYNYTFHFPKELEHVKHTVELFRLAGKKDNYHYSLVDKAISLENNSLSKESVALIDSVLTIIPEEDTVLKIYALEAGLRPLISLNKITEARQRYVSINALADSFHYELQPIVTLRIALGMKEYDKVGRSLDSLLSEDPSLISDIHFLRLNCDYYDSIGLVDSSTVYLRLIAGRQQEMYNEGIAERIPEAQIDYFEREAETVRVKHEDIYFKYQVLFIGTLFILPLILFLLNRLRLQKKDLESTKLSSAGEKVLSRKKDEEIFRLFEEISNLKESIASQQQYLTASFISEDKRDRKKYFKERFYTLNRLSERYITFIKSLPEEKISDKAEEKSRYYFLFKGVGELLDEYKGAAFLKETETVLNEQKNGIADRLKKEFTKLSPKDYKFIIFTFAELSSHAICLICGIEQTNYYNYRNRLKEILKGSSEENREEFIINFIRQNRKNTTKANSLRDDKPKE